NLTIPKNKITAIVGASGSGKTTLMKMLLKFYEPTEGEIFLEVGSRVSDAGSWKSEKTSDIKHPTSNIRLQNISQKTWRNHIGSVMQEGYIFNDTIANNIAVGVDIIDKQRLQYATDVANIKSY